jgi:hypothetical protein
VTSIGDVTRVIDMLVGDTPRIDLCAERGFAIPQDVPGPVRNAYERLVGAGYVGRLVT